MVGWFGWFLPIQKNKIVISLSETKFDFFIRNRRIPITSERLVSWFPYIILCSFLLVVWGICIHWETFHHFCSLGVGIGPFFMHFFEAAEHCEFVTKGLLGSKCLFGSMRGKWRCRRCQIRDKVIVF